MKTKGYSAKLFASGDHKKDPSPQLARGVVDLKLDHRNVNCCLAGKVDAANLAGTGYRLETRQGACGVLKLSKWSG